MLSISKITYFKYRTIAAVFNVNGGVFLNYQKIVRFVNIEFYTCCISIS